MSGRDVILLLTLAAYVGGALTLAPLPVIAGAACALAICKLRGVITRRTALLLALVFAGSALRGVLAERDADLRYETARTLVSPPARCELRGNVASTPQGSADDERWTLSASSGRCGELDVPAGTRFDVRTGWHGARRGDEVALSGSFAPVYLFDNPELMPTWLRVARTGVAIAGHADRVSVTAPGAGIAHAVDTLRAHVRERIQATYHPDAAALGRALVLGETDLDEEVADAFRSTGLSHILAVSGTHLVVTVMALCGALRELLLRVRVLSERLDVNRVVALIAIPFAWLYTDFAGGSGSVVRAAAMMTVVLGARLLERRPSSSRALAGAIAVGVVADPLVIGDVSFTLSTASTVGLLVLQAPIAGLLGVREAGAEAGLLRRGWNGLATAMATTLGATMACAPVTALMSAQLPVAGVAANLVAAPLGEVFALPFAIAHVALSPFPAVERGAAFVASGALRGVLAVARVAREAGLTLPVPAPTAYHLATLSVGALWVAAAAARRGRRAMLVLAALFAIELGVMRERRPTGKLRVTALDVGQGDALLIDLPDGSLMVVDGGGFPGQTFDVGRRVVAPVLRARRRHRIDVVVISHPHPDHYAGLVTPVLESSSVGEIWDNGLGDHRALPAVQALLDQAQGKGARLLRPAELCGAPREIGGAWIEVLSPCPEVDDAAGINDGSLVLRISYKDRSVLLMGDAELAAEEALLQQAPERLRADMLKVGHHGSRTSTTPELARAVGATHAVISCGVRNRFGHPHRVTLDTLQDQGVEVARTDLGGAWWWETDGSEVWVAR